MFLGKEAREGGELGFPAGKEQPGSPPLTLSDSPIAFFLARRMIMASRPARKTHALKVP